MGEQDANIGARDPNMLDMQELVPSLEPPSLNIGPSGLYSRGAPDERYFEFGHLPEHLQPVSRIIRDAAQALYALPDSQDETEFAQGLRKLLEAKDCFVRAFVARDRPPIRALEEAQCTLP